MSQRLARRTKRFLGVSSLANQYVVRWCVESQYQEWRTIIYQITLTCPLVFCRFSQDERKSFTPNRLLLWSHLTFSPPETPLVDEKDERHDLRPRSLVSTHTADS